MFFVSSPSLAPFRLNKFAYFENRKTSVHSRDLEESEYTKIFMWGKNLGSGTGLRNFCALHSGKRAFYEALKQALKVIICYNISIFCFS